MIKYLYVGIFLLLLMGECRPIAAEIQSSAEIRVAAFFPISSRFREIYRNALASYQVEGTTALCNCVDAWANFEWITQGGRSYELRNATTFNMGNVSLGLSCSCCLNECLCTYLGVGPIFSRTWIKNHYTCECRNEKWHELSSKFALGGILKTGMLLSFTECIFLDVFVDYSYQPFRFDHIRVDLGGLKMGLGLGYRF